MITAIVKIPIPESLTPSQYAENVKKIADRFRTIPGLVRKNFLYSEDEGVAGGVYLWESRQAADACYTEGGPWRETITSTFGVQPQISFYDTPAVVDNKAEEVLIVA
jgi:hypothetical protein